jgi:hypothetical protein
MLPPRLAAMFSDREQVRARTLAVVSGLSEEELSRGEGGEWSPGQILSHLLLAETAATLAMLSGVDPRAATFPSPPFGELNLLEWPAVIVLTREKERQAQLRALLSRRRPASGR